MSAPRSHPSTLTLHGVRLLGFAETQRIASRFGLDRGEVEENLLDFEAYGWVTWSEFAGSAGWSMTDRGRAENERRLAAELGAAGARSIVVEVHSRFLPLNARFQHAVTRWQVRPLPGDPMATNDHTDFRWDDRVIESLKSLGRRLMPLDADQVNALARFGGYAERYNAAVARWWRVRTDGSTAWESIPATRCGCSFTRISSPASVSIEATSGPLPRQPEPCQAAACGARG